MRLKSSPRFPFSPLLPACLLLSCVLAASPAESRNTWDINHGMSNPPTADQSAQGGMGSQGKTSDPNFWQHMMENRVPAGTVLSAILENDLSSGKNKAGDVFVLTLQDGFTLNGKVLIPPFSKIIGCVNSAAAAKSLRNGQPGRLQISLQSLAFPDGRHQQIFANIDGNPNHGAKKPPKVKNLGQDIMAYGNQLTAMGRSFISGPGFMMAKMNRGQDFRVDKGEVLAIRLTQDLEMAPEQRLIAQPAWAQGAGAAGVPVSPGTHVTTPGLLDPSGPIRIPGFVPTTNPGGTPPYADPNAIFNRPISTPGPGRTSSLPDPF
jgi:hypothetical protein